jgi:adenylate cyclase
MPDLSFQELFSGAYNRTLREAVEKRFELREGGAARQAAIDQLASVATLRALGHPEFEDLDVGETREGQGVVFFLDIRGFTKLSFVLDNAELLRILQALTETAVASVTQFSGHVIEFTGDGIMAVFGDSKNTPEAAGFAALHTTSFLMKGIQEVVNPALERAGTEAVRAAIGMEFGEILWSRIGIFGTTQVKPVSEATFLAGKLSTGERTKAWEAKVGAYLATWIPDDYKVQVPKFKFIANGVEYSRELFLFKWDQFGATYRMSAAGLQKRFFARKLGQAVAKSPYLAALKFLTEAGYNTVFDDSTDCPHLVVDVDPSRGLQAIVTFEAEFSSGTPSVFVRQNGKLEVVEVDRKEWAESGADLARLMAGIAKTW